VCGDRVTGDVPTTVEITLVPLSDDQVRILEVSNVVHLVERW
jgi:hypothetical protein